MVSYLYVIIPIMQLKNLLQKNTNIIFALVFGSYATNTSTILSDVDIAIYTKRDLDILEFGMLISDIEQVVDKKVDLVVLNDLYKKNAKLAFNITQSHELIFCNDEEKYVEFKSNSLQYYFDIQPMYDMFDTALVKRLNDGTYGQV